MITLVFCVKSYNLNQCSCIVDWICRNSSRSRNGESLILSHIYSRASLISNIQLSECMFQIQFTFLNRVIQLSRNLVHDSVPLVLNKCCKYLCMCQLTTVKCFIFAGSNFRGFQNWTYSWGLKFAVSLFICTMR